MRIKAINRLKLAANRITQRFGYYTAYEVPDSGYVGTVGLPPYRMAHHLREGGYGYYPLSAAKTHPHGDGVHHTDLRKSDGSEPTYQYHVHLFDVRELNGGGNRARTMVYSHRELRPDPRPVGIESFGDMVERLRSHYSLGEGGTNGVVDETAGRLLRRYAVEKPKLK